MQPTLRHWPQTLSFSDHQIQFYRLSFRSSSIIRNAQSAHSLLQCNLEQMAKGIRSHFESLIKIGKFTRLSLENRWSGLDCGATSHKGYYPLSANRKITLRQGCSRPFSWTENIVRNACLSASKTRATSLTRLKHFM